MYSTPNQHDILQISHLFLYAFGQLSNYFRCSLQPDEDGGAIPAVWVRAYAREVLKSGIHHASSSEQDSVRSFFCEFLPALNNGRSPTV